VTRLALRTVAGTPVLTNGRGGFWLPHERPGGVPVVATDSTPPEQREQVRAWAAEKTGKLLAWHAIPEAAQV
jgi:nitrous oxide reductase accessory protein NosL